MTRVHVATGAARGMGAAVARRFAGHGPVVIVDTSADGLASMAAALRNTGAEVVEVVGDISVPATSAAIADAVRGTGLALGGVGHAAGLSPTMADWRRIIEVNLAGSARMLAALDPLVVDGSAVVLFASQAASLGPNLGHPIIDPIIDDPLAADFLDRLAADGTGVVDEPGAAYGWSKRGVRRLAVRMAATWGGRGARVLSLSPGIIATPMGQQEFAQQQAMAMMVERTPLQQRMGQADEVAKVVEFLCSDGASFMTGVDVLVDGGSTAAVASAFGLPS